MAYLNGNPIFIRGSIISNADENYKAGQKSVGTVSRAIGSPAICEYVHPTEHEMNVQLTSRNLFDLDWFEANLAEGRWHYVEFNGRRCIKNTPSTDCMLKGYMAKFFPAPIKAFQFDAYCAEQATTAFALMKEGGESAIQFLSVSTDVNNWTKRAVRGSADVYGYELYVNSPYDVYIDLDSLMATVENDGGDYTPYISDFTGYQVLQAEGDGGTYIANADGTVDGVKSVSPTSLLYAATPNGSITDSGATITAEYYMDAERKIADDVSTLPAAEDTAF